MSDRVKILSHLRSVHGVSSNNALIDSLQDHRLISDLVLTVDDIPASDLMRAFNASKEVA